MNRPGAECQQKAADQCQAKPGADIAYPKETVAKAVDHVEKRVEVRNGLPNIGERMNRVKHAREHGRGHD